MSMAARKKAAERALGLFKRMLEIPLAERPEVLALLQVMLQAEAVAPSPPAAPQDVNYGNA